MAKVVWSKKRRARQSEIAAERNRKYSIKNNPEYWTKERRNKRKEIGALAKYTQQRRKAQSLLLKKLWKTKSFIEAAKKNIEKVNRFRKSSKGREETSKKTKEQWRNPKIRMKMITAQKKRRRLEKLCK